MFPKLNHNILQLDAYLKIYIYLEYINHTFYFSKRLIVLVDKEKLKNQNKYIFIKRRKYECSGLDICII